jgi:hypothetical protein
MRTTFDERRTLGSTAGASRGYCARPRTGSGRHQLGSRRTLQVDVPPPWPGDAVASSSDLAVLQSLRANGEQAGRTVGPITLSPDHAYSRSGRRRPLRCPCGHRRYRRQCGRAALCRARRGCGPGGASVSDKAACQTGRRIAGSRTSIALGGIGMTELRVTRIQAGRCGQHAAVTLRSVSSNWAIRVRVEAPIARAMAEALTRPSAGRSSAGEEVAAPAGMRPACVRLSTYSGGLEAWLVCVGHHTRTAIAVRPCRGLLVACHLRLPILMAAPDAREGMVVPSRPPRKAACDDE